MAKLHKIADRVDSPDRAEDKDALDVLFAAGGSYREPSQRLESPANGLRGVANDELSAGVTAEGIGFLRDPFGRPTNSGPGWQHVPRLRSRTRTPRTPSESRVQLSRENS
jgi:hypothetical protein